MLRITTAPVLFLAAVLCWAEERPQDDEIARLVKQLGDNRFRVREAATERLIKIGKPAVPALRAALNTEDREVQVRVRKILQTIQSSLDFLLGELNGKDVKARKEAAEALALLGAKAKAAIPHLVTMIEGKDESLRDAAASALTAIDPQHKALMKLIPAKAHVDGKYTKLLRKIHVPDDRATYGDFSDFGNYPATDWMGHKNIPAGYWVYVHPHWYIWGECKGLGAPKGIDN